MQITSVTRGKSTTTVQAVCEGQRFEYTSFNSGPWEVYDHPKSYRGVPRFLGYVPEEAGRKLDAVLRRDCWVPAAGTR